MPPGSAPSIRPGSHVKEDLVELMMIQNAQMNQVIMNNMTMSALSLFGYSGSPSGPATPRDLVIIQENEADPEIYHHYYQPAYPAWLLHQATLVYQDPNKPDSSPPHRDRHAAPPPSPHSATVTVGVNVTPAAENNSAAVAEEEKKREQ
ncbi:proline-rich protein 29-like isoform X2 [Micropterus salmoides]|nr:proline-rich protein 29-like isoform X2 [Micropterus salmoides]XP_038560750.1 proline-rich protein 29-like isoform X2 [Micropterus salmoides]XP_038560751.1 proline-rich protein 29-like isoform X2 [Micropterus salmoides]